jgi:hypothetical protein
VVLRLWKTRLTGRFIIADIHPRMPSASRVHK